MKSVARVLLLLLVWALPALAVPAPKTAVSLLLSHSSAKPGESVTAAIRLVSQPGWHTYWRNPGEVGTATTIEWQLPAAVTAGSIQWPLPEKTTIAGLQDYVYEKETLLLIPVKIGPSAKAGTVKLKAVIEWLECSDKNCVPASATNEISLIIGNESKPSASAAQIDSWRERLPKTDSRIKLSGSWEAGTDTARKLVVEWNGVINEADAKSAGKDVDFFPYEDSNAISPATEVLEATTAKVRLRKPATRAEKSPWPYHIQGLAVMADERGNHTGYEVSFPVAPLPGDPPPAGGTSGAAVQLGGSPASTSLLAILGFAFLGGLILNIMPCVLPVIALKILGFVNQSREEPKRVRELGLIYMLGVVASFLVLAGALLAARSAAGDVNWGMQMQNPYFVVAMLVIVTLVALNLWGVFEITLPGQALGAAGELASREGRSGAFYNGILATLLATPCSAPYLGAAVSAVITRSTTLIIVTFVMIGLGLAAPYVVLSWNPRLLKFLPKPGRWMEKFKFAMGFPMAATAIWLWSFGSTHFGESGGLWLGLFLLFIALGAWVYGDFAQRSTSHRGWASLIAVLIVAFGYGLTLEHELHWRQPPIIADSSDDLANEPNGIQWKRWKADAVTQARAEGHPVLIDFTAKWCVTCQYNKTTSIEIDSVKQKLKEMNAKAFLADFTRKDPKIGAAIRSYGRIGIPLVIVLPADPSAPPILLPEGPFTASTMLEALDLAAQGQKLRASSK
jgi:thiol:disulfide interchange protein/DsbC/DsbD-like thiol-disulfide interchange protein